MDSSPTRMCVGCRIREPQTKLIRVTVSGQALVVDLNRTASGRGAYVHESPECINLAASRKAFARALRVPTSLDAGAIIDYANQLPH